VVGADAMEFDLLDHQTRDEESQKNKQRFEPVPEKHADQRLPWFPRSAISARCNVRSFSS
jgi:hypothetical protein